MPPAAKKSSSRKTGSRSSGRSSSSRATSSRSSSSRATTSRKASTAFKEPAALKRLTKSLESASSALADLQKQGGRDVGKGARDIYKDLRTFLTNASRHSGRLATTLKRDFDHAQKSAKRRATGTRASSARTSTRAKSSTTSRRRGTSTTRRSTSSRTKRPSR